MGYPSILDALKTIRDSVAKFIFSGDYLLVSLEQIDTSTNSVKTIDYSHKEIHSGTHYNYRTYKAVVRNATLDHLIITSGTTKWAHMTLSVDSTAGEVVVCLYEAPETSANGVLKDTINRNRNVADNNTTEIYEAPTVTYADGSEEDATYIVRYALG